MQEFVRRLTFWSIAAIFVVGAIVTAHLDARVTSAVIVPDRAGVSEVQDLDRHITIGRFMPSAVWRFRGVWKPIIFVCWEPASTVDQSRNDWRPEKKWVREQITQTWGAVTGIRFEGWGACADNSAGIRILITGGRTSDLAPPAQFPLIVDQAMWTRNGTTVPLVPAPDEVSSISQPDIIGTELGPQVFAYGRFLDGLLNGMVLDFGAGDGASSLQRNCVIGLRDAIAKKEKITGDNGLAERERASVREVCIRHIATHMFGHALGLGHIEPPLEQSAIAARFTGASSEYTTGTCFEPAHSIRRSQDVSTETEVEVQGEADHPYTQETVMRDCGVTANSAARLSETDVVLIKRIYCEINSDVCRVPGVIANTR